MNRKSLRTISGAVLTTLVLSVFAQVWVSGQVRNSGQSLVGSWNLQVTMRNCTTGEPIGSFAAMNTYNQGGTTQQTAVPNSPFRDLPGHGAWRHQNGRDYTGAFQFFSLLPDNTLAGRVIVRSSITLAISGDSYTSTDAAEVLDPNGNLITTACSTTSATRFE